MKIRFNDLDNFLRIAQCDTFSEGARLLRISQPSLSESIKRLESDLGQVLFYRSKHGISLTPQGRKCFESTKQIHTLLAGLKNDAKSLPETLLPVITIGCHPVVGSYVLPQTLQLLGKSLPHYRVQIRHDLSRGIQREIQNGMIDIGIVVNPIPNPDLIIKRLATDQVSVWRSRLRRPQSQVLCDSSLVQTQEILKKWKNRPQNIVSSSNLELIARLTDAGAGYGIIPERAVKLASVDLMKVNSAPKFEDSICLVFRPEFGKSDQERRYIEALSVSLK